jgi:iron complex transport system substrate-binding protein
MGLGDRLVGISHECDFPEDVRGLPVCSETRIDGPSRADVSTMRSETWSAKDLWAD